MHTYTADSMTLNCKKTDFIISQGTTWDRQYLHDLYKEAYTPWEWHQELFDIAKYDLEKGTPFIMAII